MTIEMRSSQIEKYMNDFGLYLFPVHNIEVKRQTKRCSCGDVKCKSPGKHPRLYSWTQSATNIGPEKINTWNKRYGVSYNIGVCTGRKSKRSGKYLVVVDIDSKEQVDIEEKLPTTFCYKTKSGGRHYWLWSDKLVKNSVKKVHEKIDIRCKGGYVVAPPSNEYEIIEDKNIATIPDWLEKQLSQLDKNGPLVTANKKTKKSTKNKVRKCASVSDAFVEKMEAKRLKEFSKSLDSKSFVKNLREKISQAKPGEPVIRLGTRNDSIFRLLCSDRSLMKTNSKIKLMKQARGYRKLCEDPKSLTNEELERIIVSVLKYNIHTPSVLDRDRPFKTAFSKQVRKGQALTKRQKRLIRKIDSLFWSECIEKTEEVESRIPLKEVRKHYNKLFEMCGIPIIPNYSNQTFAKELERNHFMKFRNAKGVRWAINLVQIADEICENIHWEAAKSRSPLRKLTMSTNTANNTTTAPATEEEEEEKQYKTKSYKFKTQVHPNEKKYVGRKCLEVENAMNQAMQFLDMDDFVAIQKGTFIHDEDDTAEVFDEVEVDDIVGLLLKIPETNRPAFKHWIPDTYKVKSIDSDEDTMVLNRVRRARMRKRGEQAPWEVDETEDIQVAFEDWSIGMFLNYGEILYRNGEPWDLTEDEAEREIIVHIPVEKAEAEEEEEEQLSFNFAPTEEPSSEEEDDQSNV